EIAAKVTQGVVGIAAGAVAAAGGGTKIAQSFDEHDAAMAQVDKKKIDAIITKLQAQMENDREEIKKVLQEIMDGANLVSQMLASAAQSRSQIAGNLVGKGHSV